MKNTRTQEKNVYLTAKGLLELQEELKNLKEVKRREVSGKIQRAREYGDLSENSEYDAAREEQAMIEGRIVELQGILKNVEVIATAKENGSVNIGSKVKVQIDGKTDEFIIVGKVEADPAQKRISNESPVGSALLGAKKGDIVNVTTPAASFKCKILQIS
ncbi:MAG: transcription elongation factor GreA [Candidatus Daviesbacteria bacterium]|nr:transcription elongation factor GreA [Candidatus Daviesbacteria bacterium]